MWTFLRSICQQLPRKYSGLVRRNKDESDASEQVYTTSEGDALALISGTGVFVCEGFPLELAGTARQHYERAVGRAAAGSRDFQQ